MALRRCEEEADGGGRQMTRMRVSIRVPVGRPLPDLATFVVRCEDAGFDGVGIHDHLPLWGSPESKSAR